MQFQEKVVIWKWFCSTVFWNKATLEIGTSKIENMLNLEDKRFQRQLRKHKTKSDKKDSEIFLFYPKSSSRKALLCSFDEWKQRGKEKKLDNKSILWVNINVQGKLRLGLEKSQTFTPIILWLCYSSSRIREMTSLDFWC